MLQILMTMLMLFLGCVIPGQAQSADEAGEVLANITRQMAGLKTVQVDFVQEKKMAMFSAPIVLRGTLSWEQPDSFAWHIVSPIQYALIIRQEVARQWDGESDKVQEFEMSSNPIMRVASHQLQRWFSGDYQQLASEYDVSLVSRQPVVLTCVPHKDSPESGFITRVSIQFREDLRYINRITIEEVSGDLTNIRFENSRLNETIPADAWRTGSVSPHV